MISLTNSVMRPIPPLSFFVELARLAPLPIRLSVIVTTSAQWTTRFEMGKGGNRMEWLRAEMAA
jgi:hypothetical protein